MDKSTFRWLHESMEPLWGRRKDANYVASIIPKGFLAYARILHPAYEKGSNREISWSEMAKYSSKQAHAEMQWHQITAAKSESTDIIPPIIGSLPEKQTKILADILRKHTETPSEIYFALWEGLGLDFSKTPWKNAEKLELSNRHYYVIQSTLDAVTELCTFEYFQSPGLWWPKDRAWCTATDIDLMCTYVGGKKSCIEMILKDKRLEAFPANPNHRVDREGDPINGS
ncbi:MAG: hypothetical protein ACOX3Q_05705 [Clostridia bacterium]|jgi:hypothetical protein